MLDLSTLTSWQDDQSHILLGLQACQDTAVLLEKHERSPVALLATLETLRYEMRQQLEHVEATCNRWRRVFDALGLLPEEDD